MIARSRVRGLPGRTNAGESRLCLVRRADACLSSDRAVDGQPFQLAGQTYDRGIGTQSRTLLAYRIEPGDRRFQALVGVDERAGPLGSVVFRVLVDGKERFQSAPMTDRDAPKSIDVDLSKGKILILDTEFGDRGNVRDLADWVEARIIR